MKGIQETEQETYQNMWALDAYSAHSPGEQLVPMFAEMVEHLDSRRIQWRSSSVLDAGCGSGKGAIALRNSGFKVTMCDLTKAGLLPETSGIPFYEVALWDNLSLKVGYHDFVYCCDVMEHIPPAFTMLVASRLLSVARKGVFLSISLVPDSFGAWIGKPLHQSVQSFTTWRDQLATIGEIVEARDLLTSGVYLVRPR